MVHVILLRDAQSMVMSENAVYGVHEQMEQNISRRAYPVKTAPRDGYCIPFGSELKLMNYRVKKDVVAEFVLDMGCINLNPSPNNITLKNIFWDARVKSSYVRSVGPLFALIQWTMKWANRKKVTTPILVLFGIVLTSPFLLFCACLVWFNPFRPVPCTSDRPAIKFTQKWSYNIVFGMLEDPTEKELDTVQEDVL